MRTLAVNGARLLGRRTAIGRHIEYLAQHWSRTEIPFDRVVIITPGPTGIDGLGRVTEVVVRPVGRSVPALVWEQLVLPLAARRMSVLLCEYAGPILAPTAPMVVANHGIYEALPDTFGRVRRWRATSVNRPTARRSELVIANSENTASDLVRFFSIDRSKIRVVYPGAADVFFEKHDPGVVTRTRRRVVGSDDPFILFVGKLSARRNVPNLLAAFCRVRAAGFAHRLVIVGPDVDRVEPLRLASDAGISDAVVHVEHLEQAELAPLYSAADLFVLPSTYEGISWTVFEAMASGTAVIGARHAAMEEGAGDAAHVVEEPTAAALADAMLDLLRDEARRAQLALFGRARAASFSLERSASTTTALLAGVARDTDR